MNTIEEIKNKINDDYTKKFMFKIFTFSMPTYSMYMPINSKLDIFQTLTHQCHENKELLIRAYKYLNNFA